jgi:23S rRNA (uracil1939-C5)-methyltransferase
LDKDLDGIIEQNDIQIKAPFTKINDEILIVETSNNKYESFIKKFNFVKKNNHKDLICDYFGICGGCKLQHFQSEEYIAIKKNMLIESLKIANIPYNQEINFLHKLENFSQIRRKVEFSVIGKNIGFKQYKSNDVVAIKFCPLLTNLINNTLDIISTILLNSSNLLDIYEIAIVDINGKLDILLSSKKNINKDIIKALNLLVMQEFVSKISWFSAKTSKIEPLIIKEDILLNYGENKVVYHSGDFVQASLWAEQTMQNLIKKYVSDLNLDRVLDLFCGYGGYSFKILDCNPNVSQIKAVDLSLNAIKGINNLNHPKIKAVILDIFKNPILNQELNLYNLIVINPPRAGALSQIRQIASSNCAYLILVYCSLSSLSRDLSILCRDGNYEVLEINIIDQFIFTKHLEIMVFLKKIS